MRLEGRVFKGNVLLQIEEVHRNESGQPVSVQLEHCLVDLCRQMNVPIPLWLSKNTREFARFHQTIFFDGQFTEPIHFDRFQIHWLDDLSES